MIKFKRVLKMGSRGPDVTAVKIGLKQTGHRTGNRTRLFGRTAATQLKKFQHSVGLKADGVYGEKTHAKLSPHFTAYARLLYSRARPAEQPVTRMSARQAALLLLHYHAEGKYRPDRYQDLSDVQRTADGLKVRNESGVYVWIDRRVLQALCFLIQKGHTIGTFAICSDHHYDGPKGHWGGHAVDISTVDGHSVASTSSHAAVLAVARLLHSGMPAGLHPWQEICDGCGYVHYSDISAETIPGAWFYGPVQMSEHRNHIHLGYL